MYTCMYVFAHVEIDKDKVRSLSRVWGYVCMYVCIYLHVQRVLECVEIDKDDVRPLSRVWGYVCM